MPNNDLPQGGQGFPKENPDGSPALIGPDEYTRSLLRARADKVPTTVVAGNFADLQRLGADAAQGIAKNVGPSVAAPPGLDIKDSAVISPAQQEAARGEYTRETERAGTLDAPPIPAPPVNREPNPVDPGSQSPTTESKGRR